MRVVGYVTSRSIGDLCIPVPAQNSCLREYARSVGAIYVLPPLEHNINDSYMQLYTAINISDHGDTIAMYSLMMMPSCLHKLQGVFTASEAKKISFYFILESKRVENIDGFLSEFRSYELRSLIDAHGYLSVKLLRSIFYDAGKETNAPIPQNGKASSA
jgi:sporadic carbohydrate cluster protein (TIGR04323 family)